MRLYLQLIPRAAEAVAYLYVQLAAGDAGYATGQIYRAGGGAGQP